jgi:hypothetical protein
MSIDVLKKIQVDTGITGLAEIPAEFVRTNLKFIHNYRKQIEFEKNINMPINSVLYFLKKNLVTALQVGRRTVPACACGLV